ncbi:MAG: HEAT repeat domain-containing protein [Myxococcaceae bacterium]|nr:HEAT repeat domain-containing protein [Myxococcaceae bacterium]
MLLAASAYAEDARVSFLKKQLAGAKDARLRAQTCTLLGKTGSQDATAPLCSCIKDPESIVRSAGAAGLAELASPEAVACLKAAENDRDPNVRKAIERALDTGQVAATGGLYVAIEVNDKVGSLPGDVLELARDLLKQQMAGLGAAIAPPNESKAQAQDVIRKGKMKGYLLRSNLLPNGASGLKLEILIMTYPDQALQGTWNVKAAGGKPEAQLKAMVPKVVNDAAYDLEWK